MDSSVPTLCDLILKSLSLAELFALTNVSSGRFDHLLIPELTRRHVRLIRAASSDALIVDFGPKNGKTDTIFDVRYQQGQMQRIAVSLLQMKYTLNFYAFVSSKHDQLNGF